MMRDKKKNRNRKKTKNKKQKTKKPNRKWFGSIHL